MTARRWLAAGAVLVGLVLASTVAVLEVPGLRPDPLAGDAPPSSPPAADQVLRGAYLARAGNCMTCHTARGGAPYAGGRGIETPFGMVYAGNLTPDDATGIGRWSAAQFRRALHEGRSRDGRLLYPAFPYTHTTLVTPADADALFAWLRSLPPVAQANRPHALRWPYSTQTALAAWRALYFRPMAHRDEPAQSAEWNRGAYLVRGLAHCSACHGTRNALGAQRDVLDLSGGLIPMQNWYAPSLADPAEAGVAGWPLEDVVRLLATGHAPRGSALGPMAEVVLHSTQHLSPADLRAMAVFLQALPVQPSAAADASSASAPNTQRDLGARLYDRHCADCHGKQGEGVPGAWPALAGNRAVTLPVTTNLVQVVLHGAFGPATAGHPRPHGMPPFAMELNDAEVAALLSYIRGAWGHRAAPVSELEVTQQRSSVR